MVQEIPSGVTTTAGDMLPAPGADAGVAALTELVTELHGSKQMGIDLIEIMGGLELQLAKMMQENAVTATAALTEYTTLVHDIKTFLQAQLESSLVTQLKQHWKVKERIKRFHVQCEHIQSLLELEKVHESGTDHVRLANAVDHVVAVLNRVEGQHKKGLVVLANQIQGILVDVNQSLEDPAPEPTMMDLADLKQEIKTNSTAYSSSELDLMKNAFKAGCRSIQIKPTDVPHIPAWYISRSDIIFDNGSPFTTGEFLSLHYGTLDSGAKVAVHLVNVDQDDTQNKERFENDVGVVYNLRDPHVLPFFGANHIGVPLIYITAQADQGNFTTFLSSHPNLFWKVFLDAAQGLSYLHKHKHVHGNLKCSNLLVMADGTGVVSDVMFEFVRANSELCVERRSRNFDWTAPECLGSDGSANTTFESDVYALGMCVIEAVTCSRPYHDVDSDEDVCQKIRDGELPNLTNVPQEVIALVSKMCAFDYRHRIKLSEAILVMQMLAKDEADRQ